MRRQVPVLCHNPNCSFETFEMIYKCPKCGRPLWSDRDFKMIAGLPLLLLGGILAAAGIGIAGIFLLKPNELPLFGIALGAVIGSAGVGVIAMGLHHLILGRGNMRLVYFSGGMALLAFAIGTLIKAVVRFQ
ncbi:MAG: hypothetical protein WBC19_01355 [Pyrinomonadaceae bacterium]